MKTARSPGSEWMDLDDRISRRDPQTAAGSLTPQSHSTGKDSSEIATPTKGKRASAFRRASQMKSLLSTEVVGDGNNKRGFFQNLFQKKTKPVYGVARKSFRGKLSVPSLIPAGDVPFNLRRQSRNPYDSQIAIGAPEQKQPAEWNLLHRILRLKPESRVLVLSHARPHARNVICRILLNEKANGICDLTRDLENENSFNGRLDNDNSKFQYCHRYILYSHLNRLGSQTSYICS
jgi:hypothetical protein